VNPSDESLKATESAIFHPYQHQDYYGLDSLFLSPLKSDEIWNLTNVVNVNAPILAFLTLRSFLLKESTGQKLQLSGLHRNWKMYFAKSGYLNMNSSIGTHEFIPGIVPPTDTEVGLELDAISSPDWNSTLKWELKDNGKKTIFFVSAGRKESPTSKNLSELLSQFLVEIQKNDRLTRAYIRKETSSYLYLQSEDQIHPRVFFREDKAEMTEFLLFIAELIPA